MIIIPYKNKIMQYWKLAEYGTFNRDKIISAATMEIDTKSAIFIIIW
jgi:hypothetical protein